MLVQLLKPMVVTAQTTAAFTVSATQGCFPMNIQFTNASVNATNYSWNFGNGNTSSLASPVNIYTSIGVYTVILTASGPGGTSTATTTITVANPPIADFTANQTSACQDYGVIIFTNTSSSFDSCVWDFGDGSTSSLTNPSHSYYLSGLFSVSLVVYNMQHNCSTGKTRNQYITIIPKPIIDITTNDTITCDQNHVFTFNSIGTAVNQWRWSFGDGVSSILSNPSHIYIDTGFFNIQLITTSNAGCTDTVIKNGWINVKYNPVPTITPSLLHGCAPVNVGFYSPLSALASCLWDFGDGSTDTIKNPSHSYSTSGQYMIQFNIIYNNGCINNNNYSFIQIDSMPVFSFFMSNYTGCAPLNVQFINYSLNSGYTWLWDFGDGTTSTAATPSHIYTSNGYYYVSLTATNQYNCSHAIVQNQRVIVYSPKALFTVDHTNGCAPLTVNFNNHSTNATQYKWNFGDGTFSNLVNPAHIYLMAGNYIVSLVATDVNGCPDTLIYNQQIQVSLSGTTFATLPPIVACAPFTVHLLDNSTSSAWLWNFGDSATSVVPNPSHTYTQPGIYTISLNTTGINGNCSQIIPDLRKVIINGGIAAFTHSETKCPPYEVFLTDTSLNAVAWGWSFDDGGTSSLQNPSHVFSTPGYHSVALTITTSQGCKAKTIKNYEVYFEALTAKITTIVTDTTLPMTVQFSANSVGATNWFWTFGDGDSSLLENPSHIYTSAGPFTLSLTIWNDSCRRSYTFPALSFGSGSGSPGGTGGGIIPLIPIYNCAPYLVNFKSPFIDAVSWNWDFGDGDTSSLEEPTHLYSKGGDFVVKLNIQTSAGQNDSVYLPDTVHVVKFAADFTIYSSNSCSGTSVILMPDDTNDICIWDLGNGTTLNSTIGHYIYPNNTVNYLISLTATDTNGCSGSASQTFYASQSNSPTVSKSRACSGDTLYFNNGGLSYISYFWDFGDGTYSSLSNPYHIYQDSGTFKITLTVFDSSGCSKNYNLGQQVLIFNPQANFNVSNIHAIYCNKVAADIQNLSTGYDYLSWVFGDGQSSTVPQSSISYTKPGTYSISLTVSKSVCSSTFISPISIFVPDLKANFNFTQTSYCAPLTQAFIDSSNDAVHWEWNFGDGSIDTVQNPVHIYNRAPTSMITLKVMNVYGCIKSISKPNLIISDAVFVPNITLGCLPLTVAFNDSSSNVIGWNWDFGDGNFSNIASPIHQYSSNGAYSVQLITQSSYGCFDTLKIDSLINVGSIKAGLTADVTTGCRPLMIKFTDLTSSATFWSWDFGDGNFSNLQNPQHIYNAPGTYKVKLIVADSLGCSDSILMQTPIKIYGSVPYFDVTQTSGCSPFILAINNQSIGAISWEWNFGNGVTDSLQNPVYSYTTPGSYFISLQTKDTSGCVSTYTIPTAIEVNQAAVANFSIDQKTGCNPLIVNISNLSQYADSVVWNFGNGSFSNVSQLTSYTYQQAGIFNLSLVATNLNGCNDTMIYPSSIIVNQQPKANFTIADTSGCMPFDIHFNNTSSGLDNPVFWWDFGNGDTSANVNPTITYSTAGSFGVKLLVANAGGCKDELDIPGLITIYDPAPPPPVKLYSISVEDTNAMEVSWKKSNLNDINYYIIYRLNLSNGIYDSIASVKHDYNTFDQVLRYTDNQINTNSHSITYKVLAVDKCNSRLLLDLIGEHTSVFGIGINDGANINLQWSAYGGCNVSGYNIYRSDDNGSTFSYLASTGAFILHFTDTTCYCPFIYQYKIQSVQICGEINAAGNSNTVFVDHSSYTWKQVNDVVRATVVNSRFVFVEWTTTNILPQTVTGYDIYRSNDSISFTFLARVNSTQQYFEDHFTNVDRYNYYYKVAAVNICETKNDLGIQGSSILLKGDYDKEGKSILRWTPYKDWINGVDHYILEKLNEQGIWETIKIMDSKTTEYKDD